MMKAFTNTLGVLLVLLGVVGFLSNGFLGMLLGAGALYFGIKGTEFQARYFNRGLGSVLALVGVIGMLSAAGTVTIDALDGRYTSHLLKLIPGHLEFGTADSISNLIIGALALVAGFIPREMEIKLDMAAQKINQKVG
jgi:hypothetical protein